MTRVEAEKLYMEWELWEGHKDRPGGTAFLKIALADFLIEQGCIKIIPDKTLMEEVKELLSTATLGIAAKEGVGHMFSSLELFERIKLAYEREFNG